MLHFFAKLGKKPWAPAIIPSTGFFIASGYLGIHYFGHGLVRNLLAAETSEGKREFISEKLQQLITTVYLEIKNDLIVPILPNSLFKNDPPPMKWFCSSTLDPVAFGMTETRTGISIGIPMRYNYEREEDLPESIFHFKRLNFFKISSNNSAESDNNQEAEESLIDKSLEEELKADAEITKGSKIDRNSTAGKNYADSLILSENGKKFSIARELFFTDSYRIIVQASIIVLSFCMSAYFSRAAVKVFQLKEKHLANRLPFYGLGGIAGYFNYCSLSCATEEHYALLADKKAMNYGRQYQDGAIEYFTKIISRNKALRELIESERYNFDEHGNLVLPVLLKPYHWTYTDRLEKALLFGQEEQQNE